MKEKVSLIPLGAIIFLFSCNQDIKINNDEVAWFSLKLSSNHFDYARFIQAYPESKYVDSSIKSYFFYRDSLWDVQGVPMGDCFNNCAKIILGSDGRILFEDEFANVDSLHDLALRYLQNKSKDPWQAEMKEIEIPYSSDLGLISRGNFQFFLSHDSLQPLPVQEVVIHVSKAINSYKDTLANHWYVKSYYDISKPKQKSLDSILGLRFIFFDNYVAPPPPPPVDPEIEEIIRLEDIEFSE